MVDLDDPKGLSQPNNPYPRLKFYEHAKLTNYPLKAISQGLFFSHTQHNLALLQLTQKSQSKRSYAAVTPADLLETTIKKRVFLTISVPCQQHDSQSRIQCKGSD